MSGWLSYFSGTRDTKTTTRQAIVGIREQLSMLDKKEEHLEKKIEEELKKAKANATTNKSGKPPHRTYPASRAHYRHRKYGMSIDWN
jgi:hypothetical protein